MCELLPQRQGGLGHNLGSSTLSSDPGWHFEIIITCDEMSRAVLLSILSIFHQFNDFHKLGTLEISERRKRRGSRFSYQTSTFIPDDMDSFRIYN